MDLYSGYINQLIEQFAKLPGVGNKSAQRLALHIINMPKEHVERFAKIMVDAKNNIHYCKYCYTLTDEEVCPIGLRLNGVMKDRYEDKIRID